MKTLCSLMAWLSSTLFCMLIAAAVFDMLYMHQRTIINIPVPQASASKHYLDRVQLDCMAQNIFFEARGESAKGKAMVGFVVLERTMSPHFPNTICGVVKQGNLDEYGRIIRYQCSFSWMCDGKSHSIDFTDDAVVKEWEQSYSIAQLVMSGKIKPPIDMDGVTHYHANYVKPFWSKDRKDYKMVVRIGDHLFYKWRKATMPKLQLASS